MYTPHTRHACTTLHEAHRATSKFAACAHCRVCVCATQTAHLRPSGKLRVERIIWRRKRTHRRESLTTSGLGRLERLERISVRAELGGWSGKNSPE